MLFQLPRHRTFIEGLPEKHIIPAHESASQPTLGGWVKARLFQEALAVVHMADVHLGIEAAFLEDSVGQGDDLPVRGGPPGPDEFGPRLTKLPVAPHLALFMAEHRGVVSQAQRLRLILQARRHHPGDGSGKVRPEGQNLPFPVEELEHLLLPVPASPDLQGIVELIGRRDDLPVSPSSEDCQDQMLDRPLLGRPVWKAIPGAPGGLPAGEFHSPHSHSIVDGGLELIS